MKKDNLKPDPYKVAGVDIDSGNRLIDAIKPIAAKTKAREVIGGIGGFGAMYELPNSIKNPVLVSGSDGVGTKLKLAFKMGKHTTVGIDLVAMCVNDILTQGATPLFFQDYYACGKLDVDTAKDVISGIAEGCLRSNCSLIGGETAEMPGMYKNGEYDIAGFAVGVVEKQKIITGQNIKEGDILIGLKSSGLHSNGFSMVHKILEKTGIPLTSPLQETTLGEVLITPTRIYVNSILQLSRRLPINGLAHITGGGIIENLPRILPKELAGLIRADSWQVPEIFQWICTKGDLDQSSMLRIFNCGIGMIVIASEKNVSTAQKILQDEGEQPAIIGTIVKKSNNSSLIIK